MKEELIGQLRGTHEWFERSTRNLSEDDAAFAPAEGCFSTAQHVAHVAQTIDWFVEGAFRPEGFNLDFEGLEREVRAVISLAQARAWLQRSVDDAVEAVTSRSDEEWREPLPDGPIMGGAPRAAIVGAIMDHTAHHRGALTVYTRLRGKTAPLPYMEM